ncbi:[pt] ATP-dependent Clp protease ATP-binding subunit ClpB, related [Eimeria praecox]|uniref:[pt] ATP-dependent Clp protease ATP-binding subunit ClpB, related n=1 Tax=Eimeria praecox TaxID=51316 RepID=U6H219_9EIME|nr:[pt] ATP-dependent Clp protease ATP-binding subunit ClpB, related [Eimeria praecox]
MVADRQGASDVSISQYGVDLSFMAQQGLLPPVVGRDEEIDRIAQILSRKMTKAPMLLGEPGVGKTAVMEGLAQRIVECLSLYVDVASSLWIYYLCLLARLCEGSLRRE